MEQYLKITALNDFIFCPISIYYHGLYEELDKSLFSDMPQLLGKIAHKSIDEKNNSSKYIYSMTVYCEEQRLLGNIDVYDIDNRALIERKKKVKTIYDGYVYQLYAQYFCLTEMGYLVEKMFIHSLDDNKRYSVELPENNTDMLSKYYGLIKDINDFELIKFFPNNKEKCINCIYKFACEKSLYDE